MIVNGCCKFYIGGEMYSLPKHYNEPSLHSICGFYMISPISNLFNFRQEEITGFQDTKKLSFEGNFLPFKGASYTLCLLKLLHFELSSPTSPTFYHFFLIAMSQNSNQDKEPQRNNLSQALKITAVVLIMRSCHF